MFYGDAIDCYLFAGRRRVQELWCWLFEDADRQTRRRRCCVDCKEDKVRIVGGREGGLYFDDVVI